MKARWRRAEGSVPADARGVGVDDAQAERGGDGSVHAGTLLPEDFETQRGAASHVRHHGTLIKDLTQQTPGAPFNIQHDSVTETRWHPPLIQGSNSVN